MNETDRELTGDKDFRFDMGEFMNLLQAERMRKAEEAVVAAEGGGSSETIGRRLENLDAEHQAFRERIARGEIVPLTELPVSIPEFANRNRLFANGWLRKGGAAMLVSIAGSGKSVMAMQMMCCWAAGKAAFGIEPLMPLKIGYLQAEDDEQDMTEHLEGVLQGLKDKESWTDEDVAQAKANVFIVPPFVVEPGDLFVKYLAGVQLNHKFDLIFLNPLQSFAGCDIQSNVEVTKFVRKGLDRVIKNPETTCGLFIIHHTPKPPIDARTRASFGLDAFGEYAGAGASELTNWIRAMLTLVPVPKHRGIFYLTGVKRDDRLGWPEPYRAEWAKPRRIIAHTKGYLYWQTLGKVPENETEEDDRPEVEIHAERLAKFVAESPQGGLSATDLRDVAKDSIKRKKSPKMTSKQIEEAIKHLQTHPEANGLVVERGDHNTKYFRLRRETETEQPELTAEASQA